MEGFLKHIIFFLEKMLGWTWWERIKQSSNTMKAYANGSILHQYFLIQITSTYFWASEVFKNQRF